MRVDRRRPECIVPNGMYDWRRGLVFCPSDVAGIVVGCSGCALFGDVVGGVWVWKCTLRAETLEEVGMVGWVSIVGGDEADLLRILVKFLISDVGSFVVGCGVAFDVVVSFLVMLGWVWFVVMVSDWW